MADDTKAPQYPDRPPPKRVRCLGYGPEHFFFNDGTDGHRKCPACRKKDGNNPECGIRIVKDPNE